MGIVEVSKRRRDVGQLATLDAFLRPRDLLHAAGPWHLREGGDPGELKTCSELVILDPRLRGNDTNTN